MRDSEPSVVVLAMDQVGYATATKLSFARRILLMDCSDASAYRAVRFERGQSCLIESCESTCLAHTEAAVAARLEKTPESDTLIVIAGASGGDNWPGQVSAFRRSFEREFFLPLMAVKAVLPRMAATGAGKIVVVLPKSGLFADPRNASATCAHWALRRVCQSLRVEVKPRNIGVHLVFESEQRRNGSQAATPSVPEVERLSADLTRVLSATGADTVSLHTLDRLRYMRRQLFPEGIGVNRRWSRRRQSVQPTPQAGPRTAVITGASSGLGSELARCYAEHVDVLRLVGRDISALSELREELTTTGQCDVRIDSVDLADPTATADYAAQLEYTDILINCAGFSVVGEIIDISLEWFRKNMAVNFFAPVALSCAALGKQAKPRRIVNVLSTTAVAGRRGHGCYSATKAALWAFTQMLRAAVPPGVHVVEAIPATFASGFARNTVKVAAGQSKPHSERSSQGNGHGVTSAMVAEKIEDGIRLGRERICVPFNARLFLFLEAVTPALFRRLFK
jgi:short-subunit dehydrogenase